MDNALSPLIAEGLQSAGHSAIHIRDYNMQKATDLEVFARAADEDRILIFRYGFWHLVGFAQRRKAIRHSASARSKRPAVQLQLLLGAMPVMERPLSEGSIVVVEEKRIRVRRLPLAR